MTVWSWRTLQEMVGFSLVCLSSVFFTVDPLAAIPAFLAMGAGGSEGQDRRGARHAAWTCFWVLGVFASAGSLVFKLFGITLPALKIDRKSTRLNSSHGYISYAVFCLKKKNV